MWRRAAPPTRVRAFLCKRRIGSRNVFQRPSLLVCGFHSTPGCSHQQRFGYCRPSRKNVACKGYVHRQGKNSPSRKVTSNSRMLLSHLLLSEIITMVVWLSCTIVCRNSKAVPFLQIYTGAKHCFDNVVPFISATPSWNGGAWKFLLENLSALSRRYGHGPGTLKSVALRRTQRKSRPWRLQRKQKKRGSRCSYARHRY